MPQNSPTLASQRWLTRTRLSRRAAFKGVGGGIGATALMGSPVFGRFSALGQAQGNRSRAARLLNLPYKAFLYRIEKHGLGEVS